MLIPEKGYFILERFLDIFLELILNKFPKQKLILYILKLVEF